MIHIFDRSLVPDVFASWLWRIQEVPLTYRCVRVDQNQSNKLTKLKQLFKKEGSLSDIGSTFQVRWSLQSESRLHLQGELVHLPGQHWENHRCQLWRERKRFPRRRNNAWNLQTSGNLWGGRSDNSSQVRKARSISHSNKQLHPFPGKLDKNWI